MRVFILLFILTMSFVWKMDAKDIYLITTPNILLSDTTHKFNTFVTTNVALIIETFHARSKITNRTSIIVIEKGHKSISYFVPFIGPLVGPTLELRFLADKCDSIEDCKSLINVNGSFIKESREIDVIVDNFIIFSETDKPIYKPGDLVKLRAMAIYPTNLMLEPPYTGQYVEILFTNRKYYSVPTIRSQRTNFVSITIETSDNVKMAQWRNVSFEDAMKLNFTLSKDPMFGRWKITTVFGSKVEMIYFIVKKYVLPRFLVELYPPAVILLSDKNISVKVCAYYSTGKKMLAHFNGELCINTLRKNCRRFSSFLNGSSKCKEISINSEAFGLGGKAKHYSSTTSSLTVTVTENGTTHEVTKNVKGFPIKWISYEIKLMSKPYFKPGLPYFGKLKLLQNDGNPQANTVIQISAEGNYKDNWGFKQNYTSANDGTIEFVIPFISLRTSLSLRFQGEVDENSIMTAPRLYKNLANWESVDNEYIQIMPLQKPVKCPGIVQLQLLTNGNVSSVITYAQIFSRGVINKILEYKPISMSCSGRSDHIGHYECAANNQLKCLDGWKGENCRQPRCKDGCLNGLCIEPNHCICKIGWIGKSCDKCLTSASCVHGYCKYGNDCQCLPTWGGYNCNRTAPKIHHYERYILPQMTTVAPKPEPMFQKQTIFERTIDISLEKNMGPDLHIVVYYINANNEVVADSIEIIKGLTNCSHLGGGKFKFNKKIANPGEVVKLTLNTNTNRRSCAVRISDVALAQYGQSSNVNLGYLINKLTELNHKITTVKYRGLGKRICLPGRNKRSTMYPGVGAGYDSRKTFLQSGFTTFTNARVVNAKCRYYVGYGRSNDNRYRYKSRKQHAKSGKQRDKVGIKKKHEVLVKEAEKIKNQIREFFPETWIFDFYKVTPTQFNLKVPDSMTSWKANSFCMTENGIWISPTRYLTVILPFFSDIYVPYSIKTGEGLHLPVKLFSYIKECYEIKAEIILNSTEIKISGPKSFTVCICNNDVKTLYFDIKPKIMGKLNITIMAKSRSSNFCLNGSKESVNVLYSDNIRRQLLVEPPGIQAETTFSELICTNNEELGIKSHFQIPTKIVPGSLRSYLIYNGDVMGQTFDNLDNLVRMPYGCGEQNMVALVPSIYVLDYLSNLNINDNLLKIKAMKYIVEGYKRQLTYKHDSGAYSAFGKNDKTGSTWLTAFVVRSFTDASKFVTIDKKILKESVRYLEKMQQSNGCFKELGKLLSSTMAGGLKSKGKTDESLLTAYVLISLKNITLKKTEFNISKAIFCVKEGLKVTTSTYGLALSAFALSLYEPKETLTSKIVNQLKNLTIFSGRYAYWKSNLELTSTYGPINSADIETTGYALLALQNFQTISESLGTIYWLSNQRNSLGGYYSTQDTIVALNAISVYAQKIGTSSFESINFEAILDENIKHNDVLTKYNRFVTRKISLGSQNISYISLKTNGTGCISIQLVSLYNIEKLFTAKEEFKLEVKASFINEHLCTVLEIRVCSSYLRKDRDSNMILITIDFPSGWEISKTQKKDLQSQIIAPLKRIDFLQNKLHLYYDSFSYFKEKNERCFIFILEQKSKINNLKSSFVRMVDYYKPEIYIDSSYQIPTKTCKISNDTKPKPSKVIQCPMFFNDSEESVLMFIKTICPWTLTGFVKSGNNALKNRLYYQSSRDMFYEWSVDLEPSNCTQLKSWSYIKKDFVILSTKLQWPDDTLTFNNHTLLFPKNVAYQAFTSDLREICNSAKQLSSMMSRLLPDFKNETEVEHNCSLCILGSNMKYQVKNITEFICSNNTRWSLFVDDITNLTVTGSTYNSANESMPIEASFPTRSCFCLLQLSDIDKEFVLIDLDDTISGMLNVTTKPLKISLDNNFQIVESKVYTEYKTINCGN